VNGLRIEMLGLVRAWRDDKEVSVGPPRRQAVLTVLALHANHNVSRDEIVDAVWGDEPPASAVNGVHLYVAALRQALGNGGGENRAASKAERVAGHRLVGTGSGYLLRLEPGELDIDVFRDHLQRAQRLSAAGQLGEAVAALDSALQLWHGTPLSGVNGRFADAERVRLTELRLAAVEDRAGLMLHLGHHCELVAELSALVAENPLRERLRGLLMVALYRSGRQAEALATYADTRRLLVDELGIEPGADLQRLHQRMLTNEDVDFDEAGLTVADGRQAESKPGPAPTVVPRQLPGAVRHFAGRATELAALTRLVDSTDGAVTIAAIHGTAGVGKTALAVHWAHQVVDRFPDGQLYANLRGFDPTGQVMTAAEAVRGFLDALQVPADRVPLGLDAQVGLYRSLLADRRMLILLDNARDVQQVRPLLPGSPGSFVLITGRTTLTGLVAAVGARPIGLDLLAADEARELLIRRLGAQRVIAEPHAVLEIVDRCARLPLALAMVAARANLRPDFPLAMLAGELRETDDQLAAFDTGDPGSDVRMVLSWSYDALSDRAAWLFRLLGLHPGPDITAAAAASLAGIQVAEARRLLTELAGAQLVSEHRRGHFMFHDLLRAYAAALAEQQDGVAERHEAVTRVLDHYLHTAQEAMLRAGWNGRRITASPPEPGVTPEELADDEDGRAWLAAESQVLLAAIHLAGRSRLDRHAWQLAWTLSSFFTVRAQWHDLTTTQQVGLEAARRLGNRYAQAEAYRRLARAHSALGQHDEALTLLEEALAVHDPDDEADLAHTRYMLGYVLIRQGNYREAVVHAEEALARFRMSGHRSGIANGYNLVGWAYANLGNYRQALANCEQALTLLRDLGDRSGEAHTWDSIGYVHRRNGHAAQAAACYRHAVDLYRETGSREGEVDTLIHLGHAHAEVGQLRLAGDAWEEALAALGGLDHPDADEIRVKLRDLRPRSDRPRLAAS
jgi:DNA-binding SARP family transcriptional activator